MRPRDTIDVLKADPDDNRVLEAAVQGKCKYIVTGDRELLKLGTFQNMQILTPDEFIDTLKG